MEWIEYKVSNGISILKIYLLLKKASCSPMILKLRKLLTNFQNLVPNLFLKAPNNLLCQTPENGDEVCLFLT